MGFVRDFSHDPHTDSVEFEELVTTIDKSLYEIATGLAGPQGRMLEDRSPDQFAEFTQALGQLGSINNYLANWGTTPYRPMTKESK